MVTTEDMPIFCKSTTFTAGIPCTSNLFHAAPRLRPTISVDKSRKNAYLIAKLIYFITVGGIRKVKYKINCFIYLKQFIL